MRSPLVGLLLLSCWLGSLRAASPVLIVADEFPAMQILASALASSGADPGRACTVVRQDELPDSLGAFSAILVYIHGDLKVGAERALIAYAQGGGRLILLHHSISSGKRRNREWFSFLGVELPTGEVSAGGYQWIEGVPLEIFPTGEHFITTHKVAWPAAKVEGGGVVPPRVLTLEDSEVYLNHRFKGERTVLLGLRHEDPASGQVTVQRTAGWYRRAGQGWVFYFMPGHSSKEFESPVYCQILINALNWAPSDEDGKAQQE